MLAEENAALREENQKLRDEINRLKGRTRKTKYSWTIQSLNYKITPTILKNIPFLVHILAKPNLSQ